MNKNDLIKKLVSQGWDKQATPNPFYANNDRDLNIIRKVANGETYSAVGREYDISNERVRQIFWKFMRLHGLSWKMPIAEKRKEVVRLIKDRESKGVTVHARAWYE